MTYNEVTGVIFETSTVYYFYSTSAQCIAAIVSLSGAVAAFKYGHLISVLGHQSTELKKWYKDYYEPFVGLDQRTYINTISDSLQFAAYIVSIFKLSQEHQDRLQEELSDFKIRKEADPQAKFLLYNHYEDFESIFNCRKREWNKHQVEISAIERTVLEMRMIRKNLTSTTIFGLAFVVLSLLLLLSPGFFNGKESDCFAWILVSVYLLVFTTYCVAVFKLISGSFFEPWKLK